jgi:site-specific recombinase XerD
LEDNTMTEVSRSWLMHACREWFSDSELASSADAYLRFLFERGYATQTIRIYLESITHFAHWCARHRIGLLEINEGVVKRFLDRHLSLCRCARHCRRSRINVRAALAHLLDALRAGGRIAPKKGLDPGEIAEEIGRFEYYLTQVCGLRPSTFTARSKHVRAFLLGKFATEQIRISELKPADVIRFLNKYTAGWMASSKREVGISLRSYFRFKALDGEQTTALSAAIPRVAQWRLARLPKGISPDQIERLLKAFDRSSATGKRDYAITRCFVDLGLRATEVARLDLDDIDWREGLMRIRGKGCRVDILPLPPATGRSIVDYVRHGRPQTSSRALFLGHRPPRGMPATPRLVRTVVRHAAERCGAEPFLHGPQILRHTLAERLVQGGTPFKQIADLLRHRSLDTTAIYAKVDLPGLSRVALPWPGRQS